MAAADDDSSSFGLPPVRGTHRKKHSCERRHESLATEPCTADASRRYNSGVELTCGLGGHGLFRFDQERGKVAAEIERFNWALEDADERGRGRNRREESGAVVKIRD
jgi:hypothetical protein